MNHRQTAVKGRQSAQKVPVLWRNLNFLLLWSGQTVSTLGTSISTLALPLLILALTNSPALAGVLFAARQLPYLLFSLPAGVLVDRWDRKQTMIWCDLLRWLTLGSVPLAYILGHLTLLQLYLVAFVEGTAYVLFSLAQISALPQVVEPVHLSRAYALDTTTEYASTLLGPSLSAFIISLAPTIEIGAILGYLADSISYLVSVCTLAGMRVSFQIERARDALPQRFFLEIATGLRFLWDQRDLRLMALLTASINFLMSPVSLVVIVLAQDQLHLSVQWVGLILSVGGVGGVLGGVIAPWVREHLRCGQILVFSTIVWAGSFLLLTLTPWLFLLLIGWFLVSFMYPIYAVTVVSYRLMLAPPALQGRVNSAFRCLSYGSEPLGAALGGLLLGFLGTQEVFGLITVGCVACLLMAWSTGLRKVQ